MVGLNREIILTFLIYGNSPCPMCVEPKIQSALDHICQIISYSSSCTTAAWDVTRFTLGLWPGFQSGLHNSLVPSPSPHMQERGSGVLDDFSCHIGLGTCSSVSDGILNRIGCNFAARSQLSQETLQPYQVFVNHTMQQSKSSENLSPGCKM